MSNLNSPIRQLSVYEKQQLLRANLSEAELLAQGEMPVEYLTGWVDFAGLRLQVNPQVLIPRVESEELVTLAFDQLCLRADQQLNILDLGTGSGALSLALLNQLIKKGNQSQHYTFYLSDISAEALSVAKTNYQRLFPNLSQQDRFKLRFIQSDLLSQVPIADGFDLIMANLPYIPRLQLAQLPASVSRFEPLLALDGGGDGFALIDQAIKQILAGDYLKKDAALILETDVSHDRAWLKINYPDYFNNFQLAFILDQFGRQRFLVLKA